MGSSHGSQEKGPFRRHAHELQGSADPLLFFFFFFFFFLYFFVEINTCSLSFGGEAEVVASDRRPFFRLIPPTFLSASDAIKI